jgi:hypothetical protein
MFGFNIPIVERLNPLLKVTEDGRIATLVSPGKKSMDTFSSRTLPLNVTYVFVESFLFFSYHLPFPSPYSTT